MEQILPTYFATASASFIFGHWAVAKLRPAVPVDSHLKHYITADERLVVFRTLKLLACIILVFLEFSLAIRVESWENGLCFTYLYLTFLAAVPFLPVVSPRFTAIHLNIILLVSFTVYVYRDLWPLATFNLVPQDEGRLLWAKIGVLAVASVLLPLATPQAYIPVDVTNPMVKPNAEQTCSLFSGLTYGYLDPLILLAYRNGGLSPVQLPALADSDSTNQLVCKSFPVLDPWSGAASRHLFFGFLKVFKREYITLVLLQICNVALQFAGPIVMNRLLAYLQNEGKGSTIRPWVWILALFLVPFVRIVTQARYTWIATRQMTQAEGISINLLFAHALRIRLDSEIKDDDKRNLIGKINNLVTSDVATFTRVMEIWITVLFIPFQVGLAVWFLYVILGWSSLVGLAVILITLPLPSYLAKVIQTLQKSSKKKTDARVQKETESMDVLRMIKWFALESKIKDDISAKRKDELTAIRNVRLLIVLNNATNFIIPLLTMLATFSTYTLIMRRELTPSIVFTSLAVFDGVLRLNIRNAMNNIPVIIQGKVSLDRVNEFLRTTELLDSYSGPSRIIRENTDSRIGFRDVEFSWSAQADESSFRLRIKTEIIFQPGVVNLIIGPTGVGKTAVLLALLGEMHAAPVFPTRDPWFNLPREGGVAYSAQQPWLQNQSIRDNIIFTSPFDETRYQKVLHACALYPDLALFDAGDATEVGERGLRLSGGQKTRIALARALYSTASTLLLDDIFAALDVHTAKWVVKHCFFSDLVQGRTVLLVTHNVALTSPVSQWVVSLRSDGSIVQGPVDIILGTSPDSSVENSIAAGKPTLEEKSQRGMVKWSTYILYLSNISSHPILYVGLISGLFLLNEATTSFQFWFLGFWSSQYQRHPASEVAAPWYLGIYSALVILSMVLYITVFLVCASGTIRASKIIHHNFVDTVFGTTLRWLDTTPTSWIITRITQDMGRVDNNFAFAAVRFVELSIFMLAKFSAIVILSPAFLFPGAAIALLSFFTGRVYITAQLPIQRQMSAARSPLLAHFSAAISGLISIRAYGAEKTFLDESSIRTDNFIRPAITFWNLNRWIGMRSEILAGVFSACLGWYMVYGRGSHYGAANIGFSITMGTMMTSSIVWWVRIFNTLQLDANNLERVLEYRDIEQEGKVTPAGVPPAYWPASGDISAKNLSAKYSPDGPYILQDISFDIKSGERIAVVGRTGSGKSSLTLALLRCIPTEGKIFYDGLAIDSINLSALRQSITLIPQVPELLSGSLRQNLDPYGEHDDSVLNEALRAAGLFSLRGEVSLDSLISSGGGNLSVGQRQIVALARAIVRRSKLLILDEATSAIDYQTDAIIQSSLRNELGGVTLITVAHRLQTIMDYDRVMVLDEGRVLEFDTPMNLLKNEQGHLRALVQESDDRDILYSIAARVEGVIH
ncbi:P-loop containing nucleoside triphosphate hydrolase protein [Mycena rebaudengoi]|nr:P-loop containing nucleoside triphosphate hydrolase protein [Mycena rebaudengoi]